MSGRDPCCHIRVVCAGMRVDPRRVTLLVSAVVTLAAPVASADDRKWEVEGHGAYARLTQPTSGTELLGEPDVPIAAVASWYFGDGGLLLGRISQTFRLAAPTTLDGMLKRPFTTRRPGAGFGFRVARDGSLHDFGTELSPTVGEVTRRTPHLRIAMYC